MAGRIVPQESEPLPVRVRSKKYLQFIRSKPCLICGGQAEAHHLTTAQPRALGLRTGDQYSVPLCHAHHMDLHQSSTPEDTWWALKGIIPKVWAESTYSKWLKEIEDVPNNND